MGSYLSLNNRPRHTPGAKEDREAEIEAKALAEQKHQAEVKAAILRREKKARQKLHAAEEARRIAEEFEEQQKRMQQKRTQLRLADEARHLEEVKRFQELHAAEEARRIAEEFQEQQKRTQLRLADEARRLEEMKKLQEQHAAEEARRTEEVTQFQQRYYDDVAHQAEIRQFENQRRLLELEKEEQRRVAAEKRAQEHRQLAAEQQRIEEETRRLEQEAEEQRQRAVEQRAAEETQRIQREQERTRYNEELQRQQEEILRLQREANKKEDIAAQKQRKIQQDWPKPTWLTPGVNIGVAGGSGVGKSSLINRVMGLSATDAGAARTGISETTPQPIAYQLPGHFCQVTLWDLPGANTEAFPRERYIQQMGLRYFDSLVVLVVARFTETDLMIFKEALQQQIPCYLARNKADEDIRNQEEDFQKKPSETVEFLVAELQDKMRVMGVSTEHSDRAFAISSKVERYPEVLGPQFKRLMEMINRDVQEGRSHFAIGSVRLAHNAAADGFTDGTMTMTSDHQPPSEEPKSEELFEALSPSHLAQPAKAAPPRPAAPPPQRRRPVPRRSGPFEKPTTSNALPPADLEQPREELAYSLEDPLLSSCEVPASLQPTPPSADMRRLHGLGQLNSDLVGKYKPIRDFVTGFDATRKVSEYALEAGEKILPPRVFKYLPAMLKEVGRITTSLLETASVRAILDENNVEPMEVFAIVLYSFDLALIWPGDWDGDKRDNWYYVQNVLLQERKYEKLVHMQGFLFFFMGGLQKLPNWEGMLYRGIDESGAEIIKTNYNAGRRVHFSACSSATPNPMVSIDFGGDSGVVLIMHVRTGREIAFISAIEDEQEVMLFPNTAFIVIKAFHFNADLGCNAVELIEADKESSTIVF